MTIFIKNISKKDSFHLLRWWSFWQGRDWKFTRQQDGITILKHGKRVRLYNIYREAK